MPIRFLSRLRHRHTHFSSKKPSQRMTRTGDVKVIRIGREGMLFSDLYVQLLLMPWWPLIAVVAAFYLLSNMAFALVYYFHMDELLHVSTFLDAFFFSVQTMSTIGYGRMAPTGIVTNSVATIEALWGFTYFAFVTGLMFAKFTRPTAQVLFSDLAVISDFEGKPHLKIRMANKRNNRIVDASAQMFLLRNTRTKEGFMMRRFYDLPLVRSSMPLLRLTWTLLHPIDENSPLYNMDLEAMKDQGDEIFVSLVGLDETLAQTIHTRRSYFADEIAVGAFFEDVVRRDNRFVEVNYNKFHNVRYAPPEQ